MKDSNPVSTPVDVGLKLTNATEEEDSVDQPLYQSAIGSLMYLSVSTRLDISYAVSSLARFSSKPTRQHWIALKRLLRYLFSKEVSSECIGFSDADWAGDVNDRKSISGYVLELYHGAARSKNDHLCPTIGENAVISS